MPGRPVKVFHQDGIGFRVRWSKRPRVNGSEVYGWTNFKTRQIGISTSNDPPGQAAALLHEMAHVFYGTDESDVERLTRMVVMLTKANPEAMRWIVGRLCGDGDADG